MVNAISAIVAVAGTLLGSAVTYLFQSKTSQRAEESAFQRELRVEQMGAYRSLATALTEFRRGQLDWYNRRKEDPDSAATLAARVDSYRLRGVAQTALAQLQLVASEPALVAAANEAFELTRAAAPVHLPARNWAVQITCAYLNAPYSRRFILTRTVEGSPVCRIDASISWTPSRDLCLPSR